MADLSHDDYVTLVEDTYFGSVSREDIPAALACFTDDARVTIYHGDAAPRRFAASPKDGESPLHTFFDHLLANYRARFTNFRHFIDPASESCAAYFNVELAPKPDSAYLGAGTRNLNNCNFFHYRAGKIFDMIIYYADPGAAPDTPTGFPKAD